MIFRDRLESQRKNMCVVKQSRYLIILQLGQSFVVSYIRSKLNNKTRVITFFHKCGKYLILITPRINCHCAPQG